MYLLARLYPSDEQARAAHAAILAAGYGTDHVAMLGSTAAPVAATESAEDSEGEAAPVATASAPSAEDTARVRKMLGYHADFYLSRLRDGRGLVVATPPWHSSRQAELILDQHKPLSESHETPPEPFVPVSEQAAPLSNLLGLKVLADGVVLASYNAKREPFGLSKKLGMSMLSDNATPLSSMFGLSTKSNRGEAQSSSFGMPLLSRMATPFSSMFGLPTLSSRQRFLS